MFTDRLDAARQLARRLDVYRSRKDVFLLGLARGGFVVACEIGKILNLPSYPFVIRKIGHPGNPEFAIGAISEFGEVVTDKEAACDVSKKEVDILVAKEWKELERRISVYRGNVLLPSFARKIIVLVDDGIATGTTMKAAIADVRKQKSAKIVVAVPVSAQDSAFEIEKLADEVIVLHMPVYFDAVSRFYENFPQVTDEEMKKLF